MRHVVVFVALALWGCTADDAGPEHDEAADFDPVDWSPSGGKADFAGVPATFDRNTIMTDAVLFAGHAVDASAIQRFLEDTPYGTRSWLADYTIDNQRFADSLAQIAGDAGVDPIVLLARMQVESSLVSATTRPSTTHINTALGCGCPDSASCSSAYRGIAAQLGCATDVLKTQYAASVDGSGEWRLGHTKRSLDPLSITPKTHATAALYAYTPWVLTGRGGNWLVWNVTRKYLKAFDDAGTLRLP